MTRLVIVWMAMGAALATLGCATGCAPRITDDVVERVDSEQFAKRLERSEPALIDTRDPAEFAMGRIDGAVNIPLSEVGPRAENVPFGKRRTIIVYGANPGDPTALAVSKRLIGAGYKNVLYYEGGYDAWSAGAR